MEWLKFKIKTLAEAEDVIVSALYDIGIEGVQIEDNVPLTEQEKAQMFVDIPLVTPEDDGIAYISFYAAKMEGDGIEVSGVPTSINDIVSLIQQALKDLKNFMDIGEGTISIEEDLDDIDWIDNWKEYFHQFYIDDLLVIPSWEEVKEEDKDKKILHIDPGTAFGTGLHETTQLCIRQIKKYLTPETELLDVGCGSGILSIVALMYGAKSAVGTDIDISAWQAGRQNMKDNGISEDDFTILIGNIITEKEVQNDVGYVWYDIVVANILADVLVELTPIIPDHIKKGGIYITSGIIRGKEDMVINAVREAGFSVIEVTHQGEWASVTARMD